MNVHFTLAGLLWGAALCLNPPVPQPFGSFCNFSPSIAAPACAAVCLLHPFFFSDWNPSFPLFAPSFTLQSHSQIFFYFAQTSEGSKPTAGEKAAPSRRLNIFFSFPDLPHTNNPIWVSFSYSCVVVKTLERYEVQMAHCPPTEYFLFTRFAIVHCVSVPDNRSCQRVCPAPEIQTRSPCSLSPINQLGCALLCTRMCVCLDLSKHTMFESM